MTTNRLIALLRQQGPSFHGGDPEGTAEAWLEFMSGHEAEEWIVAGFWDVSAANSARMAGLTPEGAVERLKALPDSAFDGGYARDLHGRVYAACNGDVDLPW